MPSHIMDQRHLSSFFMPSAPSSLLSEELSLPSELQLGFRKVEGLPDHTCGMSQVPGSKSFSSSLVERFHPEGGNLLNYLDFPRNSVSKDQKARMSVGNHPLGVESTSSLSMSSFSASNQGLLSRSSTFMQTAANGFRCENSLFSCSFSEAFNKKLGLLSNDTNFGKSVDATNSKFVEEEPLESSKEIEAQTIGDLLPNDDDLLSGVIDDIECIAQTNSGDEDDLFCSGGGMELEGDENFNRNKDSSFVSRGASSSHGFSNSFAREIICEEHPSRTIIMRNINSSIEDTDLKILFEQFGDIRALYTASKNRGFIMVSYYDLRAARNALRALQHRLLRQQQVDIHYYSSKDSALDKDIDHATLIVSNLDSTISNDEIHKIFGSYGEIKEICFDPCNHNQVAVEFYDIRAAEAALCTLNMGEVAGKKINIEPGCPKVGWQCVRKHSSLDLEKESSVICRNTGSHIVLSREISASSGSTRYGTNTSIGIDNGSIHCSPLQTLNSPFTENRFLEISSTVPHSTSSPVRVTKVPNLGSQSSLDDLSHSLGQMNFGFGSMPTFHPHSLPEFHDSMVNGIPFNTLGSIPRMGTTVNSMVVDGFDNQHMHGGGPGHINSHPFERKEAFGVSGNGSFPMSGHQYGLNNSNSNFHQPHSSLLWPNSPSPMSNIPAPPPLQSHVLPRGPSNIMSTFVPLHHHHVGSAPSINHSLWDCLDTPFNPSSLSNLAFSGTSPMHPLGISPRDMYPHGGRNCIDPLISPGHVGNPSPQQRSHMLHGRNSLNSAPLSYDSPSDRIRGRRSDVNSNQGDNKKQFELDIDRIIRGEDLRTTLMIKNIPNKYTSKMLLATIDEHHKGTYDFIYLPIDFKNKCNVGYAFINLTDPKHICPFYQAFNGKKWEKFNSEKVASLAYARIQGKAALIAHFQNSSLMNEDKRCRPILFHSDGPNAGDQEPFPIGTNIRSRPGRPRMTNNEEHHQRSPPDSGNGDDLSISKESSSSSSKDSE